MSCAVAGEGPMPPRDAKPGGSLGLRPSVHQTRSVAWAASEARLRKDGTGWPPSLSASTYRRIGWTWRCASDRRDVRRRTRRRGLNRLIARLAPLGPKAIAVEATGGYETVVAASHSAASLPVVVVSPAQVRAFAKALGNRAKTDPIDAVVIAHFVEAAKSGRCPTNRPGFWPILWLDESPRSARPPPCPPHKRGRALPPAAARVDPSAGTVTRRAALAVSQYYQYLKCLFTPRPAQLFVRNGGQHDGPRRGASGPGRGNPSA